MSSNKLLSIPNVHIKNDPTAHSTQRIGKTTTTLTAINSNFHMNTNGHMQSNKNLFAPSLQPTNLKIA